MPDTKTAVSRSVTAHLERAVYLAKRSSIKSYKTGAVFVDRWGEVISEGWSHFSEVNLVQYRSIHAEMHAIMRADRARLVNATAYVATIRGKTGRIAVGKPCSLCEALLYEVGVLRAIYTVGNNLEFDAVSIN